MEITLKNVSYEDKLVDINYCFQEGKVTGVIGRSGSGKSLIGYVIMGLIKSYSGNVFVDDIINYDNYRFMKDVGYVFQNPRQHFFCNTVYEEISFGLKQFKFKLDKVNMQVMKSLKLVSLDEDFLDRKIDTLSSSEAVKVAIASSLVLNPKVLILDDVDVYLDNNSKKMLVKLINLLKNRYKKTVIVISSDMDFVYDVCDNYALLNEGRLIKSGCVDNKMFDDIVFSDCGLEIPSSYNFVKMFNKKYECSLKFKNNIDDLVLDVCNYEK